MSSCASYGSLTVEAALLLPAFLLTLYLFWTFFPALQAHVRIQSAMDEVTESLAEQSYLLDVLSESGVSGLPDLDEWEEEIFTSLKAAAWKSYAKSQVVSRVGKEALADFPVENGSSGLSFAGSSWDRKGDIELVVSYRLVFPGIFGLKLRISVCQHSLRKCWTGGESASDGSGEGEEDEIVYVTETGTVYHRSLDCYHLKLTIHSCALSQVENQRNESGGKYYPCERCASSVQGVSTVYITNEGNRYHISSQCSGLKRTVSTVRLSQVGNLRPCSNCG